MSVNVSDISVKTIDGEEKKLGDYAGNVLLVVNVASACGLTPQYKGLEELNQEYKDKGLMVMGFPSNDFGAQEPGTNEEIKEFACGVYKVTFEMFDKVKVLGKDRHPLYQQLSQAEPAGDVTWNFGKFLIDKQGNVIARFAPTVDPLAEPLINAVEEALAK